MAKPRRGFLFTLDMKVLNAGWLRHRAGQAEFYGLQIADDLGVPKGSVYKSLARLVALGLIDQHWEAPEVAAAAGRPPRRYYKLNQHGQDALPYARLGRRALGRQWPPDSNSVTPFRRAWPRS